MPQEVLMRRIFAVFSFRAARIPILLVLLLLVAGIAFKAYSFVKAQAEARKSEIATARAHSTHTQAISVLRNPHATLPERLQAIHTIAETEEFQSATTRELLVQALIDPNQQIRLSAAYALMPIPPACTQHIEDVAYHNHRKVGPLIGNLHDHRPYVRLASIYLLANIADRQAVVPIIHALKDPDYDVHLYAIEALGLLGDQRATLPLTAILSAAYDEHQQEVDTAVMALGRLHDSRATMPIMQLYTHVTKRLTARPDFEDNRAAMLSALADIGDRRALPLFLNSFHEQNPDVVSAGLRNVWQLGDRRAVIPLIHFIQTTTEQQYIAHAALSLGQLRDTRATMPIVQQLPRLTEYNYREIALWALGKIGDRSAVPALLCELPVKHG
jgi:HEAT repeat protein